MSEFSLNFLKKWTSSGCLETLLAKSLKYVHANVKLDQAPLTPPDCSLILVTPAGAKGCYYSAAF